MLHTAYFCAYVCALVKPKRTSPAFKDVTDLSQQQGHVTELRLPGLAEHLQVLLGDLTGWVEGQGLGCGDDLRKSKNGKESLSDRGKSVGKTRLEAADKNNSTLLMSRHRQVRSKIPNRKYIYTITTTTTNKNDTAE